MTNVEITHELRRSAVSDNNPWIQIETAGWYAACEYCDLKDYPSRLDNTDVRTFFLLVAHALEDEC